MRKIDIENVEVENENISFYIMIEYDGVKEEVSIERNTLLLCSEYKDEYENWLIIVPKEDFLTKYLKGEIGILTLIDNSTISIGKRYYENFSKITDIHKINDSIKNNIKFPRRDAKLRENFLELIQKNNLHIPYIDIRQDNQWEIRMATDIVSEINNNSANSNMLFAA